MKLIMQLIVCLVLMNSSCAFGMELQRPRRYFLSDVFESNMAKIQQQIFSELNRLPNQKAMGIFRDIVERNTFEDSYDLTYSLSWSGIRCDLQKARDATLEARKKSALTALKISAFYTLYLGAFGLVRFLNGDQSGDFAERLTGLVVLAAAFGNILPTVETAIVCNSLKNLQRKNHINAKVLSYTRANPKACPQQIINTVYCSGEVLTREEHQTVLEKLQRSTFTSRGAKFSEDIKINEAERHFAPSYACQSINTQRENYTSVILTNCIPLTIAFLYNLFENKGGFVNNAELYGHGAVLTGSISAIREKCAFFEEDAEMEKSLDDIMRVIDNHMIPKNQKD